jgi:hypothetical protein
MSRSDWPLDIALAKLSAHGLPYRWDERDLKVWTAACPSCRSGGWDLRIRESRRGGPITMICANGCADVAEALDREPIHPRIEEAERSAEQAWLVAQAARAIAARALELAMPRPANAPRAA